MRRLSLFLGSLSWGSRLQILASILILGILCWADYERKLLHYTISFILFAWFLGWVLKLSMLSSAQQIFRVLSVISIAIMMTYILAPKLRWWRTPLSRLVCEFLLVLDLSCRYWFLSELRLRQMKNRGPIAQDYDGRDPNLADFEQSTKRSDDDPADQQYNRF